MVLRNAVETVASQIDVQACIVVTFAPCMFSFPYKSSSFQTIESTMKFFGEGAPRHHFTILKPSVVVFYTG